MDPDFKERMFAKQIAVMKGQAWNVVETLKTPDHGPLELTRRAKVCVWDDLVDIPVAVPMRVTSSEFRRRTNNARDSIDEMDIGAIASSAPANGTDVDLLGVASPPADMPHPGRFEMTTPSGEDARSPDEVPVNPMNGKRPATLKKSDSEPHGISGPHPRMSYQGPSRAGLNLYAPSRHNRRYSHAALAAKRTTSIAQQLYGNAIDEDDLDGDLGYAAAEGMDGIHRKVIVERLEMVKAKNPVFSCW